MAVLGALIKWGLGGYADKPTVPPYTAVDPTKVQADTIAGNLQNLPGAEDLAARTNAFNLGQLRQMLEKAVPGYASMTAQQSNILQQQLRGEIPTDVSGQVQRNAAAQAVGGGYGGSGLHRNLVARDLGLTSLDITNRAVDSATRWMSATASLAVPSLMSAQSMFLSPQQRIAYAFQNTENQFQRDWMNAQIEALPDPAMAALGDAFIQDEEEIKKAIKTIASMYGGGGLGGGGG